jgi:hypothetical protein
MRILDVGLQQYTRECSKCKEIIIEDEVVWFETLIGVICQDCYCEIMKVKNLDELKIVEDEQLANNYA